VAIEGLDKVGSEIPAGTVSDRQAQEEKKRFGDQKRSEGKKQAVHNLFVIILWFITLTVLAIVGSRLSQLFLPEKWCWLSQEQDHAIDELIVHGTLGGIVVAILKQIIAGRVPSDERIE